MIYYFQCSKCKQTKTVKRAYERRTITQTDGNRIKKVVKNIDKLDDITCCDRLMREISKDMYRNESSINDGGARG